MQWGWRAWEIAGDISTVVFVVGFAYAIYLFASGALPVLFRLGNLRRRKIAVFAKGDASTSLVALLADAGLFNRKNIIAVADAADFGRVDAATIFVVFWPDWKEQLEQIVARKADTTALIVYAPQTQEQLSGDALTLLERHRNVVLTNFRGRLLNDIVGSFITTAYEK
jgi:hypothetical protein